MREDAVALVNQLSSAIQQDNEDTDAVPSAYPAQGMAIQGQCGRGQARAAEQLGDRAPQPPSYNTARGEQHRGQALILIPEDFEINEGDQAIPFTITDQFGRPTPARYIQVHMTNNPYVVAHLTANGPDYRGKLHATLYNGLEPVNVLTDEAIRMLEPNFPAAEFMSDTLRCMGDRSLWAKVIRFRAQFAKIERIQVQWCYDHISQDVGLCLLSPVSLFLVPLLRTFRNILSRPTYLRHDSCPDHSSMT